MVHGTYKGYSYGYIDYRELMWKGDNENCSGCLVIKDFPMVHSDLIKLMLERDYKGKKADTTKWVKGYIWIQHYFDEETNTHLCYLQIPINDMLISIEEVIDIIDEIITDVSH